MHVCQADVRKETKKVAGFNCRAVSHVVEVRSGAPRTACVSLSHIELNRQGSPLELMKDGARPRLPSVPGQVQHFEHEMSRLSPRLETRMRSHQSRWVHGIQTSPSYKRAQVQFQAARPASRCAPPYQLIPLTFCLSLSLSPLTSHLLLLANLAASSIAARIDDASAFP